MTTEEEVVAEGTWLYDGTARPPVQIVRLDHDFWYGIGEADGDLEPGEVPHLNADGHCYYVSFQAARGSAHFWPDSVGHDSLSEAKEAAQSLVPAPIVWA